MQAHQQTKFQCRKQETKLNKSITRGLSLFVQDFMEAFWKQRHGSFCETPRVLERLNSNCCAMITAGYKLPFTVNHKPQLQSIVNNRYVLDALLHIIGVHHQQGQPRCKATVFLRSASHEGVASHTLPSNALPSKAASHRTVRAVPLRCRSWQRGCVPPSSASILEAMSWCSLQQLWLTSSTTY